MNKSNTDEIQASPRLIMSAQFRSTHVAYKTNRSTASAATLNKSLRQRDTII